MILQQLTRRKAFSQIQDGDAIAPIDIFRMTWRETLGTLLDEPRFTELFLSHRRSPSPLGAAMQREVDATRQEIADDIWSVAERQGFPRWARARIEVMADQFMSLFLGAAEGLIDGRLDFDDTIDDLAGASRGIMVAELKRAQPKAAAGRNG